VKAFDVVVESFWRIVGTLLVATLLILFAAWVMSYR
jgi:hypothetical protein